MRTDSATVANISRTESRRWRVASKQNGLIAVLTFLSLGALANNDRILVYHAGDEAPVTVNIKGDLGETKNNPPAYITVKKTFYLKLTNRGTLLSFDGVNYEPYRNLIENRLTVDASGVDPAPISVMLTTSIK